MSLQKKKGYNRFKIKIICGIHKKDPEVIKDSTENVLVIQGTPRKSIEEF